LTRIYQTKNLLTGFQTREVRCTVGQNSTVDEKYCEAVLKPTSSRWHRRSTFLYPSLTAAQNKIECLSSKSFFQSCVTFASKGATVGRVLEN
jgi:hypothetical protein